MNDLISRKALLEIMEKLPSKQPGYEDYNCGVEIAIDTTMCAPTVDAVPVIRCKDCKHYNVFRLECHNRHMNGCIGIDGFCSYGERRTDERKADELLEQSESAIYWNSADKSFVEKIADHLIADHLIANGVTITPAVPGARIGHDMTEVCYRNGEEAMREKVINYLRDQKGVTMGVIRSTIGDIIEKVRKL